jgi:hypothetical protein
MSVNSLERRPIVKKQLVVTGSLALLIVVAALSTLGVLSALAGQTHGQDCAQVQTANPTFCAH